MTIPCRLGLSHLGLSRLGSNSFGLLIEIRTLTPIYCIRALISPTLPAIGLNPGVPKGFFPPSESTLSHVRRGDAGGGASQKGDRVTQMVRRLSLATVVGAVIALGLGVLSPGSSQAIVAEPSADSVGVVDVSQGLWWLRDAATGDTTSFYFGNPGDTPFTGDWDCDGVDTPGLHRQSDGYVYLRNTNTQGNADVSYFFGNPGDIPLAGDFNGDGCDTVSLYRPESGTFYVINRIGSQDAGLGAADIAYVFGQAGDQPFAGDFDGDGVDTFGMWRESTGLVQLRNSHSGGNPDESLHFGGRGDVVIAGSWIGGPDTVGPDTVGLYRASNDRFYLGDTSGAAVASFQFGARNVVPISGSWGSLAGGAGAPVSEPVLVAAYTTYHPAGEARTINIRLIADMVDGAVVPPGEVFSINAHVGERTEEKGFVRAGAIIRGVLSCCDHPINIGGGTSQFSTTLYNAAFFGAYEDVLHRPHSLYFSRYPVAREATLGFPWPDVRFRNDTAFPLTIRTEHTPTSVTVKLYGDNEGRSVATHTVGGVTPRDGGEATVYRTILFANGTSRTESWTHRYNARIDPDPELASGVHSVDIGTFWTPEARPHSTFQVPRERMTLARSPGPFFSRAWVM